MTEPTEPWRVQTGYGKGQYRNRYTLNSEDAASRYYDCINTHSGYKKRLVNPNGKIVRRYISTGHRR
jgi:hypothetical protein